MAWLDLDGLIKHLKYFFSCTLECNYNNGKGTSQLVPALSDNGQTTPPPSPGFPPRYTPGHYEEVNLVVFLPNLNSVSLITLVLGIYFINLKYNGNMLNNYGIISVNRFPLQIN